MAHVLVALIAVLVHALPTAASQVLVTVPMGMHDVVGAEHTRQRTGDTLVSEDAIEIGHLGQDIVTGIAFVAK